MARSLLTVGDTASFVSRTIRDGEGLFNFSDPKFKALVSLTDPADTIGGSGLPVTQYFERDVTPYQTLHGAPAAGGFVVPTFSGRGLPGVATGPVTIAAGEKATVTLPAAGGTTIRQAIYKSKVGTSTPLYLIAEGPDGFAGAGITLGDPAYVPGVGEVIVGLAAGTPGADAVLVQLAPTLDESVTNEATAPVPKPALTSVVPGGAGGTLDAGDSHWVALNIRTSDAITARICEFEMILLDTITGDRLKRPAGSREEIQWIEGIPAV